MTGRPQTRRAVTTVVIAATLALAAAACGGSKSAGGASGGSKGSAYNTVTPGVVTVATEAFPPYVTMESDHSLGGFEGKLFTNCVDKMGLQLKVVRVNFDGALAGVQSHRYDVTVGSVSWSEPREQAGKMTDPIYYNPQVVIRRQGTPPVTTVDQLQGKTIGTGKGYVMIGAIQQIPGAQLRTYDTVDPMFQDIALGRTDLGVVDPLIEIYTAQKRPDLKLATSYLTPPSAAQLQQHPNYKYLLPYEVVWYLPPQEGKLTSAFNGCIADDFKSGATARGLKQYGANPQQFLCPAPNNIKEREGVDRPAGWRPPHAQGCPK